MNMIPTLCFFLRVVIYDFLSFLLIYGGLGLRLGSYIESLGLGFSVDGFGIYGVGLLGWGSLYKHKKITLGKNGAIPTLLHVILHCL